MFKTKRIVLALILLVISAVGLLYLGSFVMFVLSPAQPGAAEYKSIVEVRKGQPPNEVARLLSQQRAISDAQYFIWLGKLMGQWSKLKAGEYEVSPRMTPLQVFAVITSGKSLQRPMTIREGENMYEISTKLEAKTPGYGKRFLQLCKDPKFIASLGFKTPVPPTLEGYLFPDTYFFNKTMSINDIVVQMVRRFQAVWGPAEEARAKELGMSRHELVTLASMVEKETGAVQERPLISSVFHNRLRKRMRLQSDPTTIYGIWERYKGNISKADLLAPTPYNTYTIPGLPVGPIGNPGKESIHAALNPAESEFLFFVSHNDGTHAFTRTYDEHLAAVRKFQLDPKARQGKSWRDLSKTAKAPGAPAESQVR